MDIIIPIGIGAILFLPLAYALSTISRLKRKRMHPIFRIKKRDGSVSEAILDISRGGGETLAPGKTGSLARTKI